MKGSRLADYLDHMTEAATDACGFVQGFDRQSFAADKRTQQAVIMNMIILGEAATKIMDQHPAFVQRHATVPWRAMRGMRNRIAHGYFEIDLDVVWDTVQLALPALLQALPGLRADVGDDAPAS